MSWTEVAFPPQDHGRPDRETVEVRFAGGQSELIRLQDYERVYALPGLYEEIVQRRLRCRSPAEVASLLAAAAARLGWAPERTRVLDVGAGNGVSGEELAARGFRPVLAVDILPMARVAALRDRPGLYSSYLTADLVRLAAPQRRSILDSAPNALACVGAIGLGHLPPAALFAALELLGPDALVAYTLSAPADPSDAADIADRLDRLRATHDVEQIDNRRYRHRLTVTGRPIWWHATVLRISRR
jgi:predicted TPR repeat methyltransferase